ncbi:MAG: hypothetical protein AAF108_10010 [Planctomycetota bacterium]
MWKLLSVFVVVFMLAVPPLIPAWTPGAILVTCLLEPLCLAVVIACWSERLAVPSLRVAAGVVALIYVLAAVDQIRAAASSRRPIIGGPTPIVGLLVVGVPAALFAVRGMPRKWAEDLESIGGGFEDDDLDEDDPDEDGADD